jgi:enoyl-CoA hydratase/carnithine racemase
VPRAIGPGRALDLLLTGRRINASEALQMKLVNRVVSRTGLLREAEELARKIAGYDPAAMITLKKAVNQNR